MGHELDITDGQVSYADSRTDAWHQLGQQVGHTMTLDEALDAAHMRNWNVRKVPLMAEVEGHSLAVDDRFAVVRTNPINKNPEALGVVGRYWTPFQNEETCSLIQGIVDDSGANIETVGALRGGRQTFITMKMPEHITFTSPVTGKVDETEVYLSVLNHHDGNGALRAMVTPVRIVCANTWQIAEHASRSTVSLRHTGTPSARLASVRDALGLTFTYMEEFEREVAQLMTREMSNVEVFDVIKGLWDVDGADTERQRNRRSDVAYEVFDNYENSSTVDPVRGTAYGAYNAITEYIDHKARVVGGTGTEAEKRALRTLISPEIAGLKSRAFSALMPA